MFSVLREEFLEYERELEDNAANYHKMLHNNTTLPVWMVCIPFILGPQHVYSSLLLSSLVLCDTKVFEP